MRHHSKKVSSSRRADHSKYITGKAEDLGSRHLFIPGEGNKCLNSSLAVSQYLEENLSERNRDSFFIILLNNDNKVLDMVEICDITHTTADNYTPEVIQKARDYKAVSLIFVQNVPSRPATPFQRDREICKDLKLALSGVNVTLLDHLIITRNQCYSFADNRLL